jgi:hypothetical protein
MSFVKTAQDASQGELGSVVQISFLTAKKRLSLGVNFARRQK